MSKPRSADQQKALALLVAALGDLSPQKTLKRIIAGVPDFGAFEWMLTIVGLEIDLRVDIPEVLADNHDRTAAEFCSMVAALPKIDSPGYTLECLGLVAQALLSVESMEEPASKPMKKLQQHKAQASGARTPRERATTAKRAASSATKRLAHNSSSTSNKSRADSRKRRPSRKA